MKPPIMVKDIRKGCASVQKKPSSQKCESDNDTDSFAWESPVAARGEQNTIKFLVMALEIQQIVTVASFWKPPLCPSPLLLPHVFLQIQTLSYPSCLLYLPFPVPEIVFTATFPVPSLFSIFGARILNLHQAPFYTLRFRFNHSRLGP